MNNGRPITPAWAQSVYETVRVAAPRPLVLEGDRLDAGPLRDGVARYCPEILEIGRASGFVAGGFLRDTILGEQPRDMDVYVWDFDGRRAVESVLRSSNWQLDGCSPAVRTWRSTSERIVQVIDTDCRNPAPCLSRFDLTICCVALDLANGNAVCGASFLQDTDTKSLVVQNPAYPTDTLRRVAGFVERGYSISGAELRKLHGLILADMHTQGARAYRFGEVV